LPKEDFCVLRNKRGVALAIALLCSLLSGCANTENFPTALSPQNPSLVRRSGSVAPVGTWSIQLFGLERFGYNRFSSNDADRLPAVSTRVGGITYTGVRVRDALASMGIDSVISVRAASAAGGENCFGRDAVLNSATIRAWAQDNAQAAGRYPLCWVSDDGKIKLPNVYQLFIVL
jgi:hypothetical protein